MSKVPPLLHYLPSIRASRLQQLRKLALRCAHITEELADLRALSDLRLDSCHLGDIARLSEALAALPRLQCLEIVSPVMLEEDADRAPPTPTEVVTLFIEPLRLSKLTLRDCWDLRDRMQLVARIIKRGLALPQCVAVSPRVSYVDDYAEIE